MEDRTQRLRTGLSALQEGTDLLGRIKGIEPEHAGAVITAAPLSPEITDVAPEFGPFAKRMHAARQEAERPVLSPLDNAAPAAVSSDLGHDGHER
jgi:hypothetical protein